MAEVLVAAAIGAGEISLAAAAVAGVGGVSASVGLFGALGGSFGALLLSGASLGLQYALQPRGSAEFQGLGPPPSFFIRQSAAPAQLVAGHTLTSGVLFFAECKPPWLYLGIVLSAGEIGGVRRVRINNEWIMFDPATHAVIDDSYIIGGSPYFYASFLPGTLTQGVDPILAADFSDLNADFKTPGFATAVLKMRRHATEDTQRSLWGAGVPNVLFDTDGALCWDPRDAYQDQDDPTTWTYTRNAILIAARYFNWRWGNNVPWNSIDIEALKRAADISDRHIGRLDGSTEAQYSADGVISCEAAPHDVLRSVLTACEGSMGLTGASEHKFEFRTGEYPAAATTLTDKDLRGPLSFSLVRETRDMINRVVTRFVVPDREYQVDNGPILVSAAYQSADGQENDATLDLPFTGSPGAAQRFAKRGMEESRRGKRLKAPFALNRRTLQLTENDVINFQSEFLPAATATYKISGLKYDGMYQALELELSEIHADSHAWIPSQDEQPFEIVNDELAGVN